MCRLLLSVRRHADRPEAALRSLPSGRSIATRHQKPECFQAALYNTAAHCFRRPSRILQGPIWPDPIWHRQNRRTRRLTIQAPFRERTQRHQHADLHLRRLQARMPRSSEVRPLPIVAYNAPFGSVSSLSLKMRSAHSPHNALAANWTRRAAVGKVKRFHYLSAEGSDSRICREWQDHSRQVKSVPDAIYRAVTFSGVRRKMRWTALRWTRHRRIYQTCPAPPETHRLHCRSPTRQVPD